MNLPSVNDRVSGVHILGAPYKGTITNVRQHSINADLFECMIVLDEQTQFGDRVGNRGNDFRTELIATLDMRICQFGIKYKHNPIDWTDGNGGYFNTL